MTITLVLLVHDYFKHRRYSLLWTILIIISVSNFALAANDLAEGNACLLKNGNSGVCKKLKNCLNALAAVAQNKAPVICRFVGHEPVICCASSAESVLASSAAPSTAVTSSAEHPSYNKRVNNNNDADDKDISSQNGKLTIATTMIPISTTNVATTTNVKFQLKNPSSPNNNNNNNNNDNNNKVIKVSAIRRDSVKENTSSLADVVLPSESKSSKMCKKYSQSVYVDIIIPSQLIGDDDIKQRKIICNPLQTLIVGGVTASPKEFPHMALIGYGNKLQNADWTCGASLISEKFVLSAGHCLETQYGMAKWVRLGDLNIESDNDDAKPENFEIIRRIRHPNYVRPQLYNDIALFELDREVKFSVYIKPICLNTESRLEVKHAIATGWGRLETEGLRSEELMKVTLPLVNPLTCNITFYNNIGYRLPRGIDPEIMLCAGEKEGGKDTCQGDSGGPFQIINNDYQCMYTQIGVTSFGRQCAAPNSPAVYTKISTYVKWIESIVWPD